MCPPGCTDSRGKNLRISRDCAREKWLRHCSGGRRPPRCNRGPPVLLHRRASAPRQGGGGAERRYSKKPRCQHRQMPFHLSAQGPDRLLKTTQDVMLTTLCREKHLSLYWEQRTQAFGGMKITASRVENKWLAPRCTFLIQGGGPKAHEICAQDDMP